MKDEMPPTTPPSPTAATEETPKKALRSKTVWLNAVALLSASLPAVQEWLRENPVEIVSALAALNILVRFVTSGKVSLFGTKAASLVMGMSLGGLAATSLIACSDFGIRGDVFYRDEESGAKGGLRWGEGQRPAPWVRVPVKTSSGSGWVDLRSGK